MALCTLLKLHREREGWPESVFAYTIDHKVRPESHREATMVSEWIRRMGRSGLQKGVIDIRILSSYSTITGGFSENC
jgi:tRNA(Ile)-lysidine synthase TilS/MesJ